MQSQRDSPDNISQHQCMFRDSNPSEGVRLTTPAGDVPNQYHASHVGQHDLRSQYEPSQLTGMVTDPQYWPENHPVPDGVVVVPVSFLPGHPGPHDCLHGQWYSPLYQPYAYTPGQSPEGPNGLLLPGGENLDPAIAVGGDHGISPRCGTVPGGPIHLTTNISMASSQVSYPYLVEEVCPYSAWKTHWY